MQLSPELTHGGTIADLVISAIERFPERTAFANDDATVSYAALGQRISQIAQHFDSLGLKPGDTVAQLAVNRFEVFAIVAAVYMRGLRSVMLHAMGSEADHEFVLDDCDASVVIVDSYHQARGQALRKRCGKVRAWMSLGGISGFDALEDAMKAYRPAPLVAYGDSELVVRVAYTGGTTGRPKGVMLSNRALATNVVLDLSAKEWPADVKYLCVAPISHGAGSLVVPTLMRGGCVTLMQGFSADGLIDTINKYGCNVTWLVPTMLYALLDSARVKEVDWSKFHSLIYSAAPTSPSRIRQALDLLGPILIQSYGQTESPNSILILGKHDHPGLSDAQLASAGRPYPLMRVCLLDADGAEVPAGERGEVCVRGPLLMSGYLNNPTETASTLKDGWLHTGDIAYKDADGLYYIVDRKKDMIISGGFNVYPKEIEDAICAHPSVASAAVIGIPDEKWGELVMAYVQLKDGRQVSEDEIAATVRQAKGAVATPKRVEIIDALPLTPLGKIDKKALRSRHWNADQRSVH
ncbi:AMP-binding protein [Cupriavidus necator]